MAARIATAGDPWSDLWERRCPLPPAMHRLARTLHGVESAFCNKLAQACETTAANTVAAAPKQELIHPGVMKYLREIGVAK